MARNTIEISTEEVETIRTLAEPLTDWYRANRRDLPWRRDTDPYHIWVSEIMLQQTRVEAVKPYYSVFLQELPDIAALAAASEEQILKLWEGLGYYSRVRNMQAAARQIMEDHGGVFPDTYQGILSLKGIGSYTAGAIGSIAFGMPVPAVDGNVLRVLSRITGSKEDILQACVRKHFETELTIALEEICDAPGDFNQALIELGALICVPGAPPRCGDCPAAGQCRAHAQGRELELPVRKKPAGRRIEDRTILILRDGETSIICRRPSRGLLAGMYEPVNLAGHLSREEVLIYCRQIGLTPVCILPLENARHIFSHVEWRMTAYYVLLEEMLKEQVSDDRQGEMLFVRPQEIQERYPIPSAFGKYMSYLTGEKNAVLSDGR